MDEKLKKPLERLAEALQHAVARSPEVEACLESVKDEGFQAVLWLEVTVSLSPLRGTALESDEPAALLPGEAAPESEVDSTLPAPAAPAGAEADASGERAERLRLRISAEDLDFLRSLSIRLED